MVLHYWFDSFHEDLSPPPRYFFQGGNQEPVSPLPPCDASKLPCNSEIGCGREEEVDIILHGDDLRLIQLLGRFRFLRGNKLHRLLKEQSEHRLEALIVCLQLNGGGANPADPHILTRDQKIEEILRHLTPSTSSVNPTLNWTPRGAVGANTAEQIAADIDQESSRQFRQVSFEDLVEHAQGNDAESVDSFVFSHEVLRVYLSTYLTLHPEERDRYIQVEKELCDQNPFAYQAIYHGLRRQKLHLSENFLYCNLHVLRSIHEVLTDPARSLKAILNLLPILAARFDRQYKRDLYVEWKEKFRSDIDLFNGLLLGQRPQKLALDMVVFDERDMRAEGPMISDRGLSRLGLNWNFRSEVAQECCVANPQYSLFLKKLVYFLCTYKDWNSAISIMQGLREARVDESNLKECFELLNASNNYATYRQVFSQKGGIPFLFPHVREFRKRGHGAPVWLPSLLVSYNPDDIWTKEDTEEIWLWKPTWRSVVNHLRTCFGDCT